MQDLEQRLHSGESSLQKVLEQLEAHHKIEVVEQVEQGQFLVIRLTHWAIRNSTAS